MSACRGVRGATTADANTPEAVSAATKELIGEMIKLNDDVKPENIAAAIFSTTHDLTAAYPATTARLFFGWTHVAFMSTHEQAVPDDAPLCIRVLLLVNTEKTQDQMRFVYLKGAVALRSRGVSTS